MSENENEIIKNELLLIKKKLTWSDCSALMTFIGGGIKFVKSSTSSSFVVLFALVSFVIDERSKFVDSLLFKELRVFKFSVI